MKKLFTLTFYAVLIVSLCSCRSAVETMLLEESCSTSGIHLPMPSNPNNSSEIQVSTSNYNDRVDSTALPEDEGEMLRVMAAGNQFIAALQRGEQPMNASERFIMPDGGLDALAAFERFFFLDTLYVSGVLINPRKAEPYICIISGSGRHRGKPKESKYILTVANQ